jgi:hypothetical protein
MPTIHWNAAEPSKQTPQTPYKFTNTLLKLTATNEWYVLRIKANIYMYIY